DQAGWSPALAYADAGRGSAPVPESPVLRFPPAGPGTPRLSARPVSAMAWYSGPSGRGPSCVAAADEPGTPRIVPAFDTPPGGRPRRTPDPQPTRRRLASPGAWPPHGSGRGSAAGRQWS